MKRRPRLTNEELERRSSLLWERFEKNGKITKAEVKEVTGVRYQSVYASFAMFGIDAPVVYDTEKARMARKADILNATGKSEVTTREFADLLGIKDLRHSRGYYESIAKSNKVPKLVGLLENTPDIPKGERGDTIYDMYPQGMQVMSKRVLESGDAIYQLR